LNINRKFDGECRRWIYLRCKTVEDGFEPNNSALYELTHVLEIQELIGKIRNRLVAVIAISICGLLILGHMETSNLADFFIGICTGLSLSASFVALSFSPFSKRFNKKVKAAIKQLYACE